MRLAKRLGRKPRQIAEQVTAALGDADGLLAAVEVSGPGFLNLTLAPARSPHGRPPRWTTRGWGCRRGRAADRRGRLLGPNVAKEMHVGHLRTTVIGDALVRALEFEGHTVIRPTTSATGARSSGCSPSTCSTPASSTCPTSPPSEACTARPGTGSTPSPRSGTPRERGSSSCSPATRRRSRSGRTSSMCRSITSTRSTGYWTSGSTTRTWRRELLQPAARRHRRRAARADVAVESSGAVVVASQRFTNQDGSPPC